jgi:hypothetical protein
LFTIPDDSHVFEFDWTAASSAGTNDACLSFYINGVLNSTFASIDYDTHHDDEIRPGPWLKIESSTSGTNFINAFKFRRKSFIDP